MHVRVSYESQCGLYQRMNQIACWKISWYLHQSGDMSHYCMLFSQTFYGLLFSYLTITDVTSHVHHKFPVSLVLYIATKKLNQIMAINSSANAAITQKNNSCTLCVPMFFSGSTTALYWPLLWGKYILVYWAE